MLGVVGRNGAGKSTLLKIISRVTEPTAGRVELFGRVGSLLEVGTGFHPDLTGRENIYLSGTILGMRKREIDRKFDEIVAFAEVEPFVDTPVKRYSSGMYVRLAFAIAAHLDTEILLMDEVLAVGDAEFQKKCLGKMDDVAQAGRTIVFVSHNMAAVQRLCGRGVLLQRGMVAAAGPIGEVVKQYLDGDASPRERRALRASRPHRARLGAGHGCEDPRRERSARRGTAVRQRPPIRAGDRGQRHGQVRRQPARSRRRAGDLLRGG